MVHGRIQEFSSGGPGQSDKKALTTFFFFFFFFFLVFSPQLILLKSKLLISKKPIIFQGSRGGPTFSSGVQLFPGGGSKCVFPIETYITCDFPGGVRTPCPPSGSALVVIPETCSQKIKAPAVPRLCGP